MKTVLIFLDSLNRHYLPLYGGTRAITPNIDRLANRSVVFDNHYAGSLPCMPARRELMTGRINFPETPWGAMQPFDESLPRLLRNSGVYTHLITDHYHYFEQRAHCYHTDFSSWEFMRGQEGDPWIPRVRDPAVPPFRGKNRRQDWVNREQMDLDRDEDYPTPQCFMRGIDFLKANGSEDDWFLQLEVFDPHEPFLCPARYRDRFAEPWDGPFHFDWPPYDAVSEEEQAAIEHIRACYCGTLAMADHWLGRFLDELDAQGLWNDVRIILTTDHGHLLGEHGFWAKNYMYDYQELVHLPLVVHDPTADMGTGAQSAGGRIEALTATIDIMPTILSWHGVPAPESVQGRAWDLDSDGDLRRGKHHESVLYGYWGKTINITDGTHAYTRVPDESKPLYDYTAMPVPYMGAESAKLARAETGDFLPYSAGVPVYRVPFETSQLGKHAPRADLLYDLKSDPEQSAPITDERLHAQWRERLVAAMRRHEVPESEFVRFALPSGADRRPSGADRRQTGPDR